MIWCMVLFTSICTISCNETTPIGLDIINDESLLNTSVIDSFSIKVATVEADSINTSDRTRSYLLGAINDPTFGKTKASIYTQFLLRATNPNLGEMPVFDSLVLTFAYNSGVLYGNALSSNSLSVYELEEPLDRTETYYSNQILTHNPRLVGEKRNFLYEPLDSNVIVTGIDTSGILLKSELAPHLRIRLSDELGNRILNQIGDVAFQNDANFQQFFKGLFVVPESSNNAIAFFDIVSEQSKMTLYYTNDDGGLGTLDFMMNLSTAVINRFDQDYASFPIEALLNEAPSDESEVAYVQAMSGLEVDFEVPSLSKDVLGSIALNKAELEVFQVSTEGDALFSAPVALGLISINPEDGLSTVMSSNASGFRGDTLTIDGEMGVKYNIDIDLQRLQDYLDENTLRTFTLLPSNPFTTANRMAIGGPNHPNFPMKLRLIYTSIVE